VTTEHRLGELLDEALGDGPPEAALRVQRANVLAAVRRGRRPLGRLRWELATGVLAAAALIVSLALVPGRSSPITASWRGGDELRANSTAVAHDRSEVIDFSDGSRVVLDPKASTLIVRLDATGAALSLERGRIAASVRHRDGTKFSVTAGPYEVRVVGTKFSVDWDSANRVIRVAVTEGRVRVSGGELGTRPVELAPGEKLEHRAAPSPAQALLPTAPLPNDIQAPLPSMAPVVLPPPADAPVRPAPAISSSAPAPSVGELARAGRYREALALAEERGFERVVGELPEGELLALGNAARYSGSARRAREAMLALRARFPGRPASDLAALYLAKIAEQLDSNPKEAARWLRVFLSESPSGNLAADARASLLSILLSSGDTAGATAVAREYLRHHPNGPVAERARVLVLRSEGK
jgi:transmembrane sensor